MEEAIICKNYFSRTRLRFHILVESLSSLKFFSSAITQVSLHLDFNKCMETESVATVKSLLGITSTHACSKYVTN